MSKHFYRNGSDRQRQAFRGGASDSWGLAPEERSALRVSLALAGLGVCIAAIPLVEWLIQ